MRQEKGVIWSSTTKHTNHQRSGHLSSFTIEEKEYDIEPLPERGNRSMEIILNKVLRPGLVFGYEYDFGSSTYLTLKVISYAVGKKESRGKSVRVVARNDPILYMYVRHVRKLMLLTFALSVFRRSTENELLFATIV